MFAIRAFPAAEWPDDWHAMHLLFLQVDRLRLPQASRPRVLESKQTLQTRLLEIARSAHERTSISGEIQKLSRCESQYHAEIFCRRTLYLEMAVSPAIRNLVLAAVVGAFCSLRR